MVENQMICRSCLEVAKEYKYLNQILEAGDTITNILCTVTGLQISENDDLPMQLCHECIEKLNIAYNFRIQCHNSDVILKESKARSQSTITYFKEQKNQPLVPPPTFVINQGVVQGIASNRTIEDYNLNMKPNQITLIKITDGNVINIPDDNEVESLDCENKIDEDKPICVVCNMEYPSKSELRSHLKIHKDETSFRCKLCDKQYLRIYSLQCHMATHSDKKKFLCSICGKDFHNSNRLSQHLKRHKSEKPHKCKQCEKSYRTLYILNEHIRRAHSDDRYRFSCSVCGKSFTVKSSLTSHLRIHTGERLHRCSVCGQSFTRATYLNHHMRKHTLDPPAKEFPCTYENCDKKFAAKNSLLIHIRHRHTRERPYTCEICPKAFSSLPGLREHQRTHTGDKPETCSQCQNRFVNKQSLKKHMRLHTGEKPYLCDQCDERFLSSSRLSEHVQSKHMERQHECPVCFKKFHLRRTMRGHMKAHAKDKKPFLKSIVPEPGIEVTL